MSSKLFRYIAWGLGVMITVAILYINENSFHRYGLFAADINKTMAFSLFDDLVRSFGARFSGARDWAYFLWFCTLACGVYASWRLRHKTAWTIMRIVRKIDEKA